MNTLLLGAHSDRLTPVISRAGHTTLRHDAPVDLQWLTSRNIDYIVSFGYRHIIRKPVIDYYDGRIFNLHISLLPWNRGADPNLWSHLEKTPSGITIHHIDAGLDTGDIVIQREVSFDLAKETLASSYDTLMRCITDLFADIWPGVLAGSAPRIPQKGVGSCHKSADKAPFLPLLAQSGWQTPLIDIWGKALNPAKGD